MIMKMNKPKNRLKNTQGFTLIEMIVALAIIGIMAVSFLTVFSSTYAHIFSAGRRSDAIFSTEKKVEAAIASGTTATTDTFSLAIGGRTVTVSGALVMEQSTYENGKAVSLKSFVPVGSVFSNTHSNTAGLTLEIYANELEIMVGTYYQLEANKPVTWTSSLPSVASVDTTGRITGNSVGTATITATNGSDTRTCLVRIVNKVTLAYVKGGQYVRYGGVDYIKLTGENGRVMSLSAPLMGQSWSYDNAMPSKGELEGGVWTDALRSMSGMDYWTKTKRDDDKESKPIVVYIKSNGSFDEVNSKNAVRGLKLGTSLNPDLMITSGTGSAGSPYILADPTT